MKEFGPSWSERFAQGSIARQQMIKANLAAWGKPGGSTEGRIFPTVNIGSDPERVADVADGNPRLTARKKASRLVWALGSAGLALAFLTAVGDCGGAEPGPKQPSDTGDNVPKPEAKAEREPLNPNGFLDWPYPQHANMNLVQGWVYKGFKDGQEHKASDFILGTNLDDASTWQKFAVLAAADGLACKESFGQTHAVRVRHPNGYETRNLHMDPDSISQANISACSSDKKVGKSVKRRDKLGEASDTGAEPGWWHNHFEVFNPAGEVVDPYDIYGKRDKYPDPNLTNGLPCGEKTLWINCPTGEVLGERTEVPAPTPTPTPLPTNTPFIPPSPVERRPITTPMPTSGPSPTPTPVPTPTRTEDVCASLQIPWKENILPGLTTRDELISKLGNPIKIESVGNRQLYYYASANQFRPHLVEVEQNKVTLIKEQVIGQERGRIQDYKARLGDPEKILYGQHGTFAPAHFWGCRGLAVWASIYDPTGTIVEIWYFVPTTLQNFLQLHPEVSTEERRGF